MSYGGQTRPRVLTVSIQEDPERHKTKRLGGIPVLFRFGAGPHMEAVDRRIGPLAAPLATARERATCVFDAHFTLAPAADGA